MPSHSIEWNFEELIMRKLALDARLAAIPSVHWETIDAAHIETLLVRAEKGESQLAGVKGYAISVLVKYVSGTKTPDQVDTIAAAISEAAYDPTPFNPNLPDIYFASLEPETETKRHDNKKTRTRIVTFPFIGKLTALAAGQFVDSETGGGFVDSETGQPIVNS